MKEIHLLEKFMEADPQNAMRLALGLGYSSTSVLFQWKRRGQLPKMKRNKILKHIGEYFGNTRKSS